MTNPARRMSSTEEALNPERDGPPVIAIVPARLASTRLPRKMLLDLGGAPLIVRVCENLAASRVFTKVVVAYDDEAIGDVVRGAGFEAVATSAALNSGTDRVAACAKTLEVSPDALVVNVQGDEPFLPRETLVQVVERLRLAGDDIVTACTDYVPPAGSVQPDVVKVVRGVDDLALYFSRANVPALRDAADARATDGEGGVHARHIGVYAFRADVLAMVSRLPPHRLEQFERLEQLRWLAHGLRIRAVWVPDDGAFGIDTAADLARATRRLSGVT